MADTSSQDEPRQSAKRCDKTAGPAKSRSRWRRFRQFSIAGLMLLILLSSFPLAWFGYRYNQFRRQQAALDQLTKLGAKIQTRPAEPVWFWSRVPMPLRTACVEVAVIDLEDQPVGDGDLAALRLIPSILGLNLSGTRITDDGMQYLSHLKSIRSLRLGRTSITSAGLVSLPALEWLIEFDLSDTAIDDAAAPWFEQCRIASLLLKRTGVTEKSLPALGRVENLQSIGLSRAAFNAAGIHHLVQQGEPHHLYLSGPEFGDDALVELAKFPAIEALQVTFYKGSMTMQGLKPLLDVPKCISVEFGSCPNIDNRELFLWRHKQSRRHLGVK